MRLGQNAAANSSHAALFLRIMMLKEKLTMTAIGLAVAATGWSVATGQGPKTADTKPQAKANATAKAEAVKSPEAKPKDATPTHTVASEYLKQTVALQGTFEGVNSVEIILRPETWSEFSVLEAVEHGRLVKKGDVLVRFDPEKIDEAIKNLESATELGHMTLKQAEDELRFAELATPLDMRAAERAVEFADNDLKRWNDKERAMALRMLDESLKSAGYYLEYAQEELKQLEQMYKADDLTEATEELILKRARRDADRSRLYFEIQKYDHELQTKLYLPRRDESIKESATRARMTLDKTKAMTPVSLGQKKLNLEKSKYDHAKSEEKLGKLKKDKALMRVVAPEDGYLYYGRNVRGNWVVAAGAPTTKYTKSMALRPDEVIMTIVPPQRLRIRATATEKDLASLRTGLAGKATLPSAPDEKVAVTVDAVATVPFASTYDVFVSPKSKLPAHVVPAMTCEMKFIAYAKEGIAVPAAAVFTDERDDERKYVYRKVGDAKAIRHDVKTGRTIDGKTEIVDGLKAGDIIATQKPEGAKG